ncbi:MAG: sugar phosphate isomerase/epimerase [Acidobacteria bacterium]|nr:sugar phosphate isomerase/epimerase [Acidobacteriota bacterium]
MDSFGRRDFLQMTAAAGAAPFLAAGQAPRSGKSVRLGVVVWVKKNQDPDSVIASVRQLGFSTCQVGFDEPSPDRAGPLTTALERHGVEATALLDLGPGRMVWDFYDGPLTIGLVPRELRRARIDSLKRASDLASKCGIPAIHTHCGFIPENPNDPVYKEVVAAVREVAAYCKKNGQIVLCETGQETPITLLRTFHDVGLDNLAVNLDTANLILYGKGNPVDALDVIGKYVRGLHAKDGLFPTDPRRLGEEVPIGRGKVDFPKIIHRLKQLGYSGAITIERESEGPQQAADIQASKAYLEKLIKEIYGPAPAA